jgi:hypothetical protein
MQLATDCFEWVLGKIEVNKIPFDRFERVTKAIIRDLEKRKDKAMVRTETDNLWTKIESLQWILFVIFPTRSGKMAVTLCCYFILLCFWASSSILINISGCGLINASPNLQYLPL